MRFSATLYRTCALLLPALLCACASQPQSGPTRLFNRETVIAFYVLPPGESSPDLLYRQAAAFAPGAVFVFGAAENGKGWGVITPSSGGLDSTPTMQPVDVVDVGVVHVSRIVDLKQFMSDPEKQRENLADAARSTTPWKIILLPEPVLSATVPEEFDELSRLLERHGALLALSPAAGYMRSRPVGSAAGTAVRYISLSLDASSPSVDAPWLARSLQGGRFAVLRAADDRLNWVLYDADGKLLDLLVVRRDKRADGASDFLLTGEVSALIKYGKDEETEQP